MIAAPGSAITSLNPSLGSGFRVWGLGSGFRVWGLGFEARGSSQWGDVFRNWTTTILILLASTSSLP